MVYSKKPTTSRNADDVARVVSISFKVLLKVIIPLLLVVTLLMLQNSFILKLQQSTIISSK